MHSLREIFNKFFKNKKKDREYEIKRDKWGRLKDSDYPSSYKVSWNDLFEERVLHDLVEVPAEDKRLKEEFQRLQWKKFKELQERNRE